MTPPKTIKIGSDWWVIRVSELSKDEPGKFGHTDFDSRTIHLDSNQSEEEMKYTLAHELLHAVVPALAEEPVSQYESVIRSVKLLS